MNENSPSGAATLSSVCQEAVEAYRASGKVILAPAIRKVIESIIRQKSEHVNVLRPLDHAFAGKIIHISLAKGSGPETVLEAIVKHEKEYAAILDAFAPTLPIEDHKLAVHAIADASRKFASWTQDHLDLLAMF
jgi:rubrerythrin